MEHNPDGLHFLPQAIRSIKAARYLLGGSRVGQGCWVLYLLEESKRPRAVARVTSENVARKLLAEYRAAGKRCVVLHRAGLGRVEEAR